jgi:DNA-binding HxlR family transcriptional regulator
VLGEGASSLDVLLERLGRDYDLDDGTREALAARLEELVEAGLIERA